MNRSRTDRILADWDSISRQARPPSVRPRTVVAPALPGSALAGIVLLVVAIAAASMWLRLPRDGIGATKSPGEWGPLAIVPPSNAVMEALTAGTLRITDACVVLEDAGGDVLLLVWPADRTTWDAGAHAITLGNLDGSAATLRDGDQVSLGGGGGSVAEGGVSGEQWVRQTDWIAPPAPSCPIDAYWYVGEAVGDR